MGAIGPVLGNYFETLTKLSRCLAPGGLIIIDDGYSNESSAFSNSKVFKKSDILQQISDAGMILVDEEIVESCTYKDADDFILGSINKRRLELINVYPTKANLFLNYIANEERETQMLRTDLICSTMAIRRF